MYTIIENFSGHTLNSYNMGKEAFIAAHKGIVSNVEKVWEQVEKDALNTSEPVAKSIKKATKKSLTKE